MKNKIEIKIDDNECDYEFASQFMLDRVKKIYANEASELLWLTFHSPLYTMGTSAKKEDIISNDLPVIKTNRGGQITYHGPGQRVVYAMIDLNKRGKDIRKFVTALENSVIATLDYFNIKAETNPERVGVWIKRPDKAKLIDGSLHEDKIAAIGIRIHKWITYHGLSLNINPDLRHYDGIVPCGIKDHGVTSLEDLGYIIEYHEVDQILINNLLQQIQNL